MTGTHVAWLGFSGPGWLPGDGTESTFFLLFQRTVRSWAELRYYIQFIPRTLQGGETESEGGTVAPGPTSGFLLPAESCTLAPLQPLPGASFLTPG